MNMKKIVFTLLLLFVCFGLVACDIDIDGITAATTRGETENDPKPSDEILGEWTSFDYGITAVFLEDGTGTYSKDGSFTWKYDKDLKYYTVAISTDEGVFTADTVIQTTAHSAITYITIRGERFYRMENDDVKDCQVITVTSKYMAPTIHNGDTILCHAVKNAAELAVGDLIAYWTVVNGERVAYASRIKSIHDAEGYLLFETQDDCNDNPNALTVHQTEILGKFVQVLISNGNSEESSGIVVPEYVGEWLIMSGEYDMAGRLVRVYSDSLVLADDGSAKFRGITGTWGYAEDETLVYVNGTELGFPLKPVEVDGFVGLEYVPHGGEDPKVYFNGAECGMYTFFQEAHDRYASDSALIVGDWYLDENKVSFMPDGTIQHNTDFELSTWRLTCIGPYSIVDIGEAFPALFYASVDSLDEISFSIGTLRSSAP